MQFVLRFLVFLLVGFCALSQTQQLSFPPLPDPNAPHRVHLGVDELLAKGLIRPMLLMMNAVIKNFSGGDEDPTKNKTEVEEVEELLSIAGENVTFTLNANETEILAIDNGTAPVKRKRRKSFKAFKLF